MKSIYIYMPYIIKYINIYFNQKRSILTPRPGFGLFECDNQKISVLVFLMGQNPKCPGYKRKEPRRQVQIYFRRVFLPPPSPVLAKTHSILAYHVPRTEDVGLPTKFRFNGSPLQPIAGSMSLNRLRRRPNPNLSAGVFCLLHYAGYALTCRR